MRALRLLAVISVIATNAPAAALTAPDSLRCVFDPDTCLVRLSWNAPPDDGLGFVVERRLTATGWRAIGESVAGVRSFVDRNVVRDTLFFYRVAAFAGPDTSAFSAPESIQFIGTPSIAVLSPTAGDIWHAGDTQYVDFTTRYVNRVAIYLSTDGGLTFTFFLREHHDLRIEDPGWGHYRVIAPDSASDQCIIRVKEYATDLAQQSGTFRISPAPAPAIRMKVRHARLFPSVKARLQVLTDVRSVRGFSLDGRRGARAPAVIPTASP